MMSSVDLNLRWSLAQQYHNPVYFKGCDTLLSKQKKFWQQIDSEFEEIE